MSDLSVKSNKNESLIENNQISTENKAKLIEKLMNGFTSKSDEQQIKQILLNASPSELSTILDKTNLKKLSNELNYTDVFEVMNKLEENKVEGNNQKHLEELSKLNDTGFNTRILSQGAEFRDRDAWNTLKTHQSESVRVSFADQVQRSSLSAKIDNSNLSSAEKEIAKSVLSRVSDENLEKFDKLLTDGTLSKRDSQGVTVLENLNKIASTERNENLGKNNISAEQILNQTIVDLANPLSISQGSGKGTCGACTMQYMLLRNDPAEFTKMVEGLTGKEGSVTLRDGKKLTLPENSIPRDSSQRKDLDRMIQSAIMNEANLMGLDYDNPSDDGGFIAVLGGNSAIPVGKFQELYQSITGRPMDDPSCYLWGEGDVGSRIQDAVARGEDVPVMLSYGGAVDFHWLTVQDIKYDQNGKPESVTLRNPWGHDRNVAEGAEEKPPRKHLGNGLIEMKWSDFQSCLNGAVIPKDIADKPIASEKLPVEARVNIIKELMSGYTNGQEEQTIRGILTSSSPQDLSAILDKVNASDLVSELDHDDAAKVMEKLAKNPSVGNNAKHLGEFMKEANDDLTMSFLSKMNDEELRALAATPDGKAALEQAWKNLDAGWTNGSEENQMKRIKTITG